MGRTTNPVPYPSTSRDRSGTKKKSTASASACRDASRPHGDHRARGPSAAVTSAMRRDASTTAWRPARAGAAAWTLSADPHGRRLPGSRAPGGQQHTALSGSPMGSTTSSTWSAYRHRIRRAHEIDPSAVPVDWSRCFATLEQRLDVAERTASEADVDHGADQHPDHVVQEAVGLTWKLTPRPSAGHPLRSDRTAAVVRLGLSLGGEGAECGSHPGAGRPRTASAAWSSGRPRPH